MNFGFWPGLRGANPLDSIEGWLAANAAVWLDPSDLSSMKQGRTGASATIAAAVDSPVGSMRNKGTAGGWLTASADAARPILRQSGASYLDVDLVDDALSFTLPSGITGDVVVAGVDGTVINGRTYSASSAFSVGPNTYTGAQTNLFVVTSDIIGVFIFNFTLTESERALLVSYIRSKGGKGLFTTGPTEMMPNGDFSDPDISMWTPSSNGTLSVVGGRLRADRTAAGYEHGRYYASSGFVNGAKYQISIDCIPVSAGSAVHRARLNGVNAAYYGDNRPSGTYLFKSAGSTMQLDIGSLSTTSSGYSEFDNISIREIRPTEEW